MSKTGKRWRPEFPSEARANAEIRRILGHVNKHGVDSTRLTASQSVDARAALRILEGANLECERVRTPKKAADHYVKQLKRLRHSMLGRKEAASRLEGQHGLDSASFSEESIMVVDNSR